MRRPAPDKVIRALVRAAAGVLAAMVLAYPADWAVWRVRMALGAGMGTVTMSHMTVAELKGNKESYYVDGTSVVDCSRSLFPEAGSGACWWLRRHAEVVTRY